MCFVRSIILFLEQVKEQVLHDVIKLLVKLRYMTLMENGKTLNRMKVIAIKNELKEEKKEQNSNSENFLTFLFFTAIFALLFGLYQLIIHFPRILDFLLADPQIPEM